MRFKEILWKHNEWKPWKHLNSLDEQYEEFLFLLQPLENICSKELQIATQHEQEGLIINILLTFYVCVYFGLFLEI